MKRFTYLAMRGLLFALILIFLPIFSGLAKAANVPITYPGDTQQTIERRAQWIEEAKKEGAITWWGVTPAPVAVKISAAFNKIYPFIKIDYWRGEGEEIATKLEMNYIAKKPSCDIAHGGEPVNFPRWRKTGLLQPYIDIIPGIKTWDKRRYSAAGDSAQPGNQAITPQYNTNLVSAAEVPKSWEDLLDPKWKGYIGITTDVKCWTTLALHKDAWGILKAEDFLTKLSQQDLLLFPLQVKPF